MVSFQTKMSTVDVFVGSIPPLVVFLWHIIIKSKEEKSRGAPVHTFPPNLINHFILQGILNKHSTLVGTEITICFQRINPSCFAKYSIQTNHFLVRIKCYQKIFHPFTPQNLTFPFFKRRGPYIIY